MNRLREFMRAYIRSPEFGALQRDTDALLSELDAVTYNVHIDGGTLTVERHAQEENYSEIIEAIFDKFRQGGVRDHRVEFNEYPDMNHIEAQVLEFVARLYPEPFSRLQALAAQYLNYRDATVAAFEMDVQFYLGYLDYMSNLERVDTHFCFPEMSIGDKQIQIDDCFDISLAYKLTSAVKRVVCNDFSLSGNERMIVVSGPNQGGKTTFARMFGQVFYLASLGCPVPGTAARLFLSDHVYTHFERQENIDNLRGKLKDDLVRIHQILGNATSRSVLVMNEIFTSTSLADARYLSEKIMSAAHQLDVIGVWVTFVEELAAYSDYVVSMISTVDPGEMTTRTFKVVRAPATGRSYAMSLAGKYELTSERIKERIHHESPSDA